MGKNKNKKYRSGVDLLYFAPILNIDYDKIDADPADETAYTYGNWFRARGAQRIDLANQFSSNRIAADNNASYVNQKKNNGYNGNIELTTLPPQFYTDICLMKDFTETDDVVPLGFAVGYEYKEEGVKCRRVLYHNELTQLPGITHTTESGELAIDSDSISINTIPREGDRKITSVCTEGDPIFNDFFNAVPKPSDFTSGSSITLSGDSTVEVGETITLTAVTVPSGKAVTWSSLDEDNATVNQYGVVTGVAKGTVTIKCELTEDPATFNTITINVTEA